MKFKVELWLMLPMVILIGPPKLWLQWKIKVNVVHAGLSLQLLPLRVEWLLVLAKLCLFLSNNLLTALDHMGTKDAMEDGWTLLSNMLEIKVLLTLLHIPMLPEIKLVAKMQDLSKSLGSLMSRAVITSSMLWALDLFQLLLMPPTGVLTEEESFPTAIPMLTMVSCWLVQLMNTGKSRTLGELTGEKLDSLELPEETPALSANILPIPPFDHLYH